MSGVWTDYKMTVIENQKLMWLPYNDKTKTIFYDQRVVLSAPREEPVCWSCSKVEDMNVRGVSRYTFKQDKWSDHTDYIEKDINGNIIGMWCNWFGDSDITPTDPDEPTSTIYSKITYSGVSSTIKVGGSYKTFTVTFYDNETPISFRSGYWSYTIDGEDVSNLLVHSENVEENQTKIKFTGGDEYIGKTLLLSYSTVDGKVTSSLEVAIVGL